MKQEIVSANPAGRGCPSSLHRKKEESYFGVEVDAFSDNIMKWHAGSACKGPYIKDVRKIFGFLDPLPPLSEFWLDL